MDMSTINWMAVFVAAIANFVIGGLWYSPALPGKVWMRANGFTEESLKGGNMGLIFGVSFICCLVMSVNLATFLNDAATDMAWGATAGFLAGFGWVAMAIIVISLFERRSGAYMFVNAGYMIVAFVVMGLIIGAWR
jgi:hypothetical protein